MSNLFSNLLNMHGHGRYIWSAYFIVAVLLSLQWFIPWRRFKHYRRTQAPKSLLTETAHERHS